MNQTGDITYAMLCIFQIIEKYQMCVDYLLIRYTEEWHLQFRPQTIRALTSNVWDRPNCSYGTQGKNSS